MNGTRSMEREMQVRTFSVQGADGRLYEFKLKTEDSQLLNRIDRELNRDNRAESLFNFIQDHAGTRRLEVRVAEAEGGPWSVIIDADYMRDRMFQRDISPPRREVSMEAEAVSAPVRTTATIPTRTRPAGVEQGPEAVATRRYAVEVGNQRFEFAWNGPRPANVTELYENIARIQGSVSRFVGGRPAGTLGAEEAGRLMFAAMREAREYGREGRLIELS